MHEQVGDLAQLDESEAPKEGYARVYVVPVRDDAAAESLHNGAATAKGMLQVSMLPSQLHATQLCLTLRR